MHYYDKHFGIDDIIGEVGVEVEEFAVSTDGTTSRINSMFDRALEIERLTEELELKQHHFEQLPTYLPVSGLRLSSGFGMRKHPISGKYRMHKGLDFAGPSGTRVSAALAPWRCSSLSRATMPRRRLRVRTYTPGAG